MAPDVIESVIGNVAGTAVIWAAIRVEIRFLWRDLGELKSGLGELKKDHNGHVKEVALELGKCLKQT